MTVSVLAEACFGYGRTYLPAGRDAGANQLAGDGFETGSFRRAGNRQRQSGRECHLPESQNVRQHAKRSFLAMTAVVAATLVRQS